MLRKSYFSTFLKKNSLTQIIDTPPLHVYSFCLNTTTNLASLSVTFLTPIKPEKNSEIPSQNTLVVTLHNPSGVGVLLCGWKAATKGAYFGAKRTTERSGNSIRG